MKQIILATNNAHKLSEFRTLFAPLGMNILSLKDLHLDIDVEETGTTFAANAMIKAETIMQLTQLPVIADDSGLEVDALGGAPGIYSARYAGNHGDNAANNLKLLRELIAIQPKDRTARFVCAIAYAKPGGITKTFIGTCEGHIGLNTGGEGGFGYDPLFIPIGYHQSFAQLGSTIKNTISHRTKALEKLVSDSDFQNKRNNLD